MNFLFLLLIAHLLGDFFLQPNSWVRSKFKKGIKSSGFWKHIAVHGLLLAIVAVIYPEFWLGIIIVFAGHAVIDGAKIAFLRNTTESKNKIKAFLLDQFLHIVLILAVVSQTSVIPDWEYFLQPEYIIVLLGYLFITLPASSIIKVLLSNYTWVVETPENPTPPSRRSWTNLFIQPVQKENVQRSLKNGGHYIGLIERILVFTFILIGQWSAVGFLITAKSVFRFGDLNQGKNREFTEYVLIGTLLSFGMAIFTAILTKFIIAHMT